MYFDVKNIGSGRGVGVMRSCEANYIMLLKSAVRKSIFSLPLHAALNVGTVQQE
jgi:ferredoxin-fold anticodon binding domain-containing protein